MLMDKLGSTRLIMVKLFHPLVENLYENLNHYVC